MRGLRTVVVLGALLATTAGCDLLAASQIDQARTQVGAPAVARSATLATSAEAHAQANCDAGRATASPDAYDEYDAETAKAAGDVAGSAVLDPSIADPRARLVAATRTIVAGWSGNPTVTDTRWDQDGVGSVLCPDGRLYMTAAFTQKETLPPSGRYQTPVYADDQITHVTGLQYGTAVDYLGVNTDLLLDLWTPPTTGGPAVRPLMILIHGGAFAGGSRSEYANVAVQFATRGWVVASIDYRLRPTGDANRVLLGARDAIDDGLESVRWLKAHAADYAIDTTRVAADGNSAGGAIALGMALVPDPTPGGPLGSVDPSIEAAMSTGANLTAAIGLVPFTADQAAILMVNYETDSTAGGGNGDYSFKTCQAVRDVGNTCDFVEIPGEGHTTDINMTGPYWTDHTGPFLFQQLRLDG